MSVRAAVVIPAAGGGVRLGGLAKAFLPLCGEPMLLHTLRPFLADPRIVQAVVALAPSAAAAPPDWLTSLDARISLVAGGETRGDSVYAALAHIGTDVDVVLVHDAARPLVTTAVVARAIDAAAAGRSVIAAVPVTDTIQEVDGDGRIRATPDRQRLWQAQTPQAFPRHVVISAYARAAADGFRATDDAAIVSWAGEAVHVIEGAPENIKVTSPPDVVVAEALLAVR